MMMWPNFAHSLRGYWGYVRVCPAGRGHGVRHLAKLGNREGASCGAQKSRRGCLIRGHKRGGPLVCQSATLHHSRPEGWGARGSVLGMDSRGLDQFAMTPGDLARLTPAPMVVLNMADGSQLVGVVQGQDGDTLTIQPFSGPGPVVVQASDVLRRLDV